MPVYAGAAGVTGFVRVQLKVYDTDGVLADPDDVAVTVTLPDGTTSDESGNVVQSATGVYYLDYAPEQVGHYGVYWVTTGVNAGTLEEGFNVDDLTVSPPLSLSQVKAHLNIDATDISNDDELRAMILAATDYAEGVVGPMSRRTVTETVDGRGRSAVLLSNAPAVTVSAVLVNGVTVSDSGYSLDTEAGVLHRVDGYTASTWTDGFRNVEVTYTAGRTSIPAGLQHAVLELVRHLWETQRGVSRRVRSGDDYVPGAGYTFPNRVREALSRWEQPGIA